MKRFIYETYYIDQDYHEYSYWESDNFRSARKEIKNLYKNDKDIVITMIAEIKFEDYSHEK